MWQLAFLTAMDVHLHLITVGRVPSRLRDECLNAYEFVDLTDAQERIEAWHLDYNHHRPHGALDKLTRVNSPEAVSQPTAPAIQLSISTRR